MILLLTAMLFFYLFLAWMTYKVLCLAMLALIFAQDILSYVAEERIMFFEHPRYDGGSKVFCEQFPLLQR